MKPFYLFISFFILWQFVESEDYVISGTNQPPLVLKNSICGFKQDDGPCKAIFIRYFFNIFTRQCEVFEYGGCDGNENNYKTLEECQEKCIITDSPPKKGRKKFPQEMPDFCSLEEDPGICRGYISRYFYNTRSKQCEKFKYGGCLGNRNNFMTLIECQSTCSNQAHLNTEIQPEQRSGAKSFPLNVPTAISKLDYNGPSLCRAHVNRGNCESKERRFHYDYLTGKCHPFAYTGCGGNENNFISRRACMKICKKGAKSGRSVSTALRARRLN